MKVKIIRRDYTKCSRGGECGSLFKGVNEFWLFECPLCNHTQLDFVVSTEVGNFLLPMEVTN